MRINSTLTIAGTILLLCTTTTQADIFGKLKDKSENAAAQLLNKKAQKKEQAQTQTASTESNNNSVSLGDGPDSRLVSFTKCAGLELTNIMTGNYGEYSFQQGFSKEKRSGLVNRKKGKVSKGCILPSLNPNEVVYMEVDTQKFDDIGHNWTMQCVKSANPEAGAVSEKESRSEYPVKVTYLSGKDIMLHCGHSENLADSCAEGSNSTRSRAWDDELEKRGKTMLTVLAKQSRLAPAGGEKLYCQYYNKKTRTSLFAFEYLRTPF